MKGKRDFAEIERHFLLGRGLLQRCLQKLLQGSELRSEVEHYLSDSQRKAGLVASNKGVVQQHATFADSGPKSCVNCAHHSFDKVVRKEEYHYIHYCNKVTLRDVVTGAHTLCDANRRSEAKCGLDARYFEARTKP